MPGGAHENMKAWSPEEDTLIIAMHESEGPKWSKIVQRLPGRTVSSVRNRWQRIEKGRKLREAGVESKNRCHACGQPKRGHVCYAKLNGGPQVDVRSGLSVKPSLQGGPAFGMAPPAPRTNLKELLTNSGRTGSMSDLFKSEVFSTDSTGLFPAPPAGSAGNPLFRVDLDATVAQSRVMARKCGVSGTAWSPRGDYLAVAIEGGLITPIIKDADQKGLAQISTEMKDLATRARDRKLKPEEYQGGTFSLSNLGMFGISSFSSIINPPQGMILSVGAGEERPVITDGALAKATVMTVTLTCDHRVVDGANGARWLSAFKGFIEDPMTMLM